jgi:hypothetical protein
LGNLPDLKRRQIVMAASSVAAILLSAAAHRLAGELDFAPRFASPDAVEVVRARIDATLLTRGLVAAFVLVYTHAVGWSAPKAPRSRCALWARSVAAVQFSV